MKRISILYFAFVGSIVAGNAQSTGDYRSINSGNWNTIAVWERFDGTWQAAIEKPDSTDGIITIRSPNTVTINIAESADQLIVASGGILTIESTLTLNNGPGEDVTVAGIMNFNSGTLAGAGTVSISNAGALVLSTNLVKTTDANISIVNNGTMTWQEGGINGAAPVFNNNVFNISATALWHFSGGLTNSGTINKTSGSTNINTPWSNSGTINLSGGTLTSSDVFTNTGIISFSNGAAWQNNSTFNHNTGSVVSGTGTFSNGGILALAIDQVFPSTLVFSNTGTINGVGALTINNDFVIQGSITGGAMTLNGNGDWQDGILGRSLTMDAGRTLLLSTAFVKSLSGDATLTNNGTMTWQEGGVNADGNVINNGEFNISATATWQFSGGIANSGTINKTSGSTTINTTWSNSGTINLSGGTLTSLGVFTNTGMLSISGNAAWQNNSTFNHNMGSVVSGTGSFNNIGTLALAIDQVFPSTLVFSNTNFITSGSITGAGALTINNDFVIVGSITGGAMTLNGNGDWQGGTLGRSLTMDVGRTLLLSTAIVKTLSTGTTLTNNGTMTWQEGGINGDGSVINNGVLNISASALWQHNGGLTNHGIISNTGTPELRTLVTNSATGTIRGVGTMLFSITLINNGTLAPGLSPGILEINGAQPFSSNSILTIEIQDGSGVGTGHDQLRRNSDLTLSGTLTVTETGTVPDGIYVIVSLTAGTISGNFTTTNLPTGYAIQVNPTNVRIGKNVPLPLTLIAFNAKKTADHKVELQWTTVDEQNVSHFEVQRSPDGVLFTQTGTVQAQNSPSGATYHYLDEGPMTNINYYRLRIVDLDASVKFSPISTVKFIGGNQVQVFPSITSDKVQIVTEEEVMVRLFSMSGTLLQQKLIVGNDLMDLSYLPASSYIFQYGNERNSVRIVKQ